jgi:hypothetical protein
MWVDMAANPFTIIVPVTTWLLGRAWAAPPGAIEERKYADTGEEIVGGRAILSRPAKEELK